MMLLKLSRVRACKAIDGLVGVTDEEETPATTDALANERSLRCVEVLRLVNEDPVDLVGTDTVVHVRNPQLVDEVDDARPPGHHVTVAERRTQDHLECRGPFGLQRDGMVVG